MGDIITRSPRDMTLEQKVAELYDSACVTNDGTHIVVVRHRPEMVEAHENALKAVIQSVRDETLEEAARECDALGRGESPTDRLIGYDIAAECIRSLRGKPL